MSRIIKHLVVMGDSLSDRGTMDHRKLLGLIPMDTLSGLKAKATPDGRFTNGYNWADDLAVRLAIQFELQEFRVQDGMTVEEVTEALDRGDKRVKDVINGSFFLADSQHIRFQGTDLMRSYAEGGLTAHDYRESLDGLDISSPSDAAGEEGARLTVATLSQKREALIKEDRANKLSKTHKSQSLIIEWSGANDLITVNKNPSAEAVNKAVKARIENIEALIQQGYRNFVLYNLPDLSLTPRFQNASEDERDNAHAMSLLFNEKLSQAVAKLKHHYPRSCQIELFDIGAQFTDMYQYPEEYGFDPEKQKTPYTSTNEFKSEKNESPSEGYMFWDDVHPTAQMHEQLSIKAYAFITEKFRLSSPHELSEPYDVAQGLVDSFTYDYDSRLKSDKSAWIVGFFRNSRLVIDPKASPQEKLDAIFDHAINNKGYRTREILQELGWLDKNNHLPKDSELPSPLVDAYQHATNSDPEKAVELTAK